MVENDAFYIDVTPDDAARAALRTWPEQEEDDAWQAAADALSDNSSDSHSSSVGGANSPSHSAPISSLPPAPLFAPWGMPRGSHRDRYPSRPPNSRRRSDAALDAVLDGLDSERRTRDSTPAAGGSELPPPPAPLSVPAAAPVLAPDFECGMFWDYENISLPRGMDGAVASNRLREVCLRFGRLVERRVYHDPAKVNSVQEHNRSALDMAGFTLVDCPTRNLKETIDKKIIVDVMHFALTRVARQQPACVVLLTNDGDYAYMLARLRDLQVRAVVILTSPALPTPPPLLPRGRYEQSSSIVRATPHRRYSLRATAPSRGEPTCCAARW